MATSSEDPPSLVGLRRSFAAVTDAVAAVTAGPAAPTFSAHEQRVVNRYGGNEFEARMKAFPDGYHNLGFWEHRGVRRADASRTLIFETARRLGASPGDSLLDVGAGVGYGTIEVAEELSCGRTVGIDLTPDNVAHARMVAARRRGERISFETMSATRLDFADASFDRILAVDCAVHFDTRETFLAEALRVLKPGGTLAIADTVISESAWRRVWRPITRALLSTWCVPAANVYGLEGYRARLTRTGFVGVSAESIGARTLAPACDYFMSREQCRRSARIDGAAEAVKTALVFAVMKLAFRLRLIDYGLFVAVKPAGAGAQGTEATTRER
jgi:cyclopropane fatty-acyl-phospholipid synthase-like methyltransferase